jgi:hypothetical protein
MNQPSERAKVNAIASATRDSESLTSTLFVFAGKIGLQSSKKWRRIDDWKVSAWNYQHLHNLEWP